MARARPRLGRVSSSQRGRVSGVGAAAVAGMAAVALGLPGLLVRASLPTPSSALVGDAVYAPGARPAPPFTLADQAGRPVSLRGLRAGVVLVTFMDSRCRSDCPVEAAELALLQRQLGRLMPLVVVVSTDPRGDTPQSIRAFAARYHLREPYRWLVGSRTRLAPVWRAYGIEVRSTSVHSSAIYLIDRAGDERVGWGIPFPPSLFARDARALHARRATGWRWPWQL
ncbi:MAG TPA: SCO family protein [Candidatus Micrarchaeia archaeon]|nr:SCO family protein [Candidatus Micrarchaeia archaeon]